MRSVVDVTGGGVVIGGAEATGNADAGGGVVVLGEVATDRLTARAG